MAQIRLSSNLSRGNNQDGDLVSSKCIQTLDGQCYTIQSYIAGDRLRSIEKRLKKLAAESANFSVVRRRRCYDDLRKTTPNANLRRGFESSTTIVDV